MAILAILSLHVFSGAVGLLSGVVAVCVRKGGRVHALSGVVFSVAMLSLGASGALLATLKGQTGNVLGGILTVYMVGTAWKTARDRSGTTGVFDWSALLAALAIGTSCVGYGLKVVRGGAGAHDGVPAGMDFFLGAVVLVAAAGDVRMLARGGIRGTQRIARHLWRMCFGLFIASGSFFMGRQRIFPEVVRRSNVLLVLTILPLILLIFWMVRVWFTNVDARRWQPREGV